MTLGQATIPERIAYAQAANGVGRRRLPVPDGWQNHLPWASMELAILTFGPGKIALDYVLGLEFKCRGRADPTAFLIRRKGAPPIGVFLAARGDPLTTIDFARNERPARPPERLAINRQDAPAGQLTPDKPAEKRRDFADACAPPDNRSIRRKVVRARMRAVRRVRVHGPA